MLILAEGSIRHPIPADDLGAVRAWFGPMVDGGFMISGYVDEAGKRLWMVLSCESLVTARQRLDDLPIVRDGAVTFTTVAVNGLRFS